MPFVVVIAWMYGRRSRPALQEAQQRIAELTADAEENVSGVRVIKAFAQEERQLHRFQHSVARVFDQQMYATKIQARYTPLISFLPNLGLALILLIGGRDVINGTLTIGAVHRVLRLSAVADLAYADARVHAERRAARDGVGRPHLRGARPRRRGSPPPRTRRRSPTGRGRVSLRDVSLTFDGATQPALRDVDLEIEPGRTVALVGAMGSGKTALVSLLPRLYEVSSGSVQIDGADVRSVDLHSLRQSIAVVTDDPFLFSATIHDNIAYARAEATREEVERAAEVAQAAGFIEALPNGYDTLVGERGLTLSGGQRQRIAIARAVLADPRVLVLDDATSSVDASTEQEIKQALGEVMADRTTFVVAHRLSTIALADEIVVLEHGRVAAHGTHDDLLEESDLYREIVEKGMPDQVFMTRNAPEAVGL